MNHYQQGLVVEASRATVYAALTTPEGLRGWWTQDCDVTTEVGGTSWFRFGRQRKAVRIERLDPRREVRWACTGAHIAIAGFTHADEWIGTQIVFRLIEEAQGRTLLEFEHIGLVPAFECFKACRDGWRLYLRSLQLFVETGRGTPYERVASAAGRPHQRISLINHSTGQQP